jgi:hypothetical protein
MPHRLAGTVVLDFTHGPPDLQTYWSYISKIRERLNRHGLRLPGLSTIPALAQTARSCLTPLSLILVEMIVS